MQYRYLIAFGVIISLCVLLDLYTWHGLKKTVKPRTFRFFKWFIPISTFFFFTGFIYSFYRSGQGVHNASYGLNLLVGFTFGVFIAKLLIATPFLLEDIGRIIFYIFKKIKAQKGDKVTIPSRRKFIRNISLALAAIPLSGTIYAITRGKYNYQLIDLPLSFDTLPASFQGLKIVQFSDFHAGSFDDYEAVEKGLAIINEQNPDLVVFTGDLVNNRSAEAIPFIDMLKKIKAPLGKFAILGNHDYGDYRPFESEEEKKANFDLLDRIFEDTGFQLLKNDTIRLERGNESIYLSGLENWGKPPFPQYGDFENTIKDIPSDAFTILLSHDPDHWEYEVREHPRRIDLTLSGHTHGAQFGVDIPGWKWSPVKYRYRRWLGLYEENKRHLFVSKGFGFLGFPGRIGMSPEIVSIQLTSKNSEQI